MNEFRVRKSTLKLVVTMIAGVLILIPSMITLAKGGQDKVAVCHLDGQGNFSPITIADPALDAHLAHGDAQPVGAVPGMPDYSFDANCAAVITYPVDVCHLEGDGGYSLLTIPASQLDAYQANGDAQPGEKVPGLPITPFGEYTIFDVNCTPLPSIEVCQWGEEDGRYNLQVVPLSDWNAYIRNELELSWPPTSQPGAPTPAYPAPYYGESFDNYCNIVQDPCTVAVQSACAATGGYCISGSAICILPPDEEFFFD